MFGKNSATRNRQGKTICINGVRSRHKKTQKLNKNA